jgi:phosphopantothenoylcysteine synthetase/decarboxylase
MNQAFYAHINNKTKIKKKKKIKVIVHKKKKKKCPSYAASNSNVLMVSASFSPQLSPADHHNVEIKVVYFIFLLGNIP